MTLDYIVLGVVVAALLGAIVMVWRKFPVLASMNVEHLSKHRQLLVKGQILERRLLTKFRTGWHRVGRMTGPVSTKIRKTASRLTRKIESLEREYQRNRQLPDDQRRHHILQILADADRLVGAGSYADAEKKYIEVVSLDQRNLDAYRGLGDVYLGLKDYSHAKDALEFALSISSRMNRGVPGEMTGVFPETKTISNELAVIHADLGEAHAGLNRMDAALLHLSEAIRLEPANPKYLDRYTEFAILFGDRRRTEEGIQKLREVNPENQKIAEFEQRLENLLT